MNFDKVKCKSCGAAYTTEMKYRGYKIHTDNSVECLHCLYRRTLETDASRVDNDIKYENWKHDENIIHGEIVFDQRGGQCDNCLRYYHGDHCPGLECENSF